MFLNVTHSSCDSEFMNPVIGLSWCMFVLSFDSVEVGNYSVYLFQFVYHVLYLTEIGLYRESLCSNLYILSTTKTFFDVFFIRLLVIKTIL